MKSILIGLMSIFLLTACERLITAPPGKDTWVTTIGENSINCTINSLDLLILNADDPKGVLVSLIKTSPKNYGNTTHCPDGISFYLKRKGDVFFIF